jgi:phosphate transport system substrate-binding protein
MFQAAVAVFLMFALCGCNSFFERDEPGSEGSLLVAGAFSMLPLAEKLTDAFSREKKGLSTVCEGGGSTAGIVALRRGVIDIALLSRDVAGHEDEQNVRCLPYARNGVGLVVHHSNALSDLLIEQIHDILTGGITDWEHLGGKSGSIHVISRDARSATLRGVNDLILHGEEMAHDAVWTSDIRELAEKVAADPKAVGIVSYSDMGLLPTSLRGTVKTLTVQGVPMQRETILSGRYPLTRVLYFAVRNTATPAAQAFLDFALGDHGKKVTRGEGLLLVR